ncbi:MAG TPA: YicC/YloC family endoribonuclease [Rubrivivax sp.]|nr:YicC/YloC family endoribonuclease [Rubrivivax sp.]
MAVYSMTGYASAAQEAGENSAEKAASVTVEARSVNGRFLDLALRLPDELRGLEPALRELLTGSFRRGKIELRVATSREAENQIPRPTHEQLQGLRQQQTAVHAVLPQARALSVNEVLNWCKGGSPAGKLDESALSAARHCVQALKEARAREGDRLAVILMERVHRLRELAAQAAPLLPAVVQRQQARFLERWNEALASVQAASSVPVENLHERAMGEAASFAIRIDVAEELARLGAHLDEIDRLLKAGGELGKRLEFLIQELQREANTLGSKSAALELTTIALEMKVAVEQMREQVQNVE